MRIPALCLAALLGLPGVAAAQASVDIHFDLPVVLPRMVVVSPGVQVVPEVQEEVFFYDGWYWARRDDYWYRSRSHRGGWMLVPARAVPQRLGALPPGHYRNWKAEKEERKAERKAWKEARKDRRDWERDHDRDDHDRGGPPGRGRGHGHGRD